MLDYLMYSETDIYRTVRKNTASILEVGEHLCVQKHNKI